MKMNFKKSLLATSLILCAFSFSACGGSQGGQANQMQSTGIQVPETLAKKTSGHHQQIRLLLLKMAKLEPSTHKNLTFKFKENSYNGDTDSFDISQLETTNSDDPKKNITAERMVKDGVKSLQMLNLQFVDHTSKDYSMLVKHINFHGNMADTENIDVNLSTSGLLFHVPNPHDSTQTYKVAIKGFNLVSKINDDGVNKLSLGVVGADFGAALQNVPQVALSSLIASFDFHKTSDSLTDNNYQLKFTSDIGYDKSDKSKISQLKYTHNAQLDNSVIKSLVESSKNALKDKDQFTTKLLDNAKFVSTIINFKNNGFVNSIMKQQPEYKKQLSNPSAKQMVKSAYGLYMQKYNVLTDKELDNLIDVLFNTLLQNKDLNLTIKTIKPLSFLTLGRKIIEGEKVLTVESSN